MTDCRWDREAKAHLTRAHLPDCVSPTCPGCRPCTQEDGNPVRHCRARARCTSHLGWTEHACPECVGKIRANLHEVTTLLALMPEEAEEQGINSEAANLAGPHADYVRAQWRLVNADRAGQTVEELDMLDPYTCLTMHERYIREHLGHDETTLVSDTIAASAGYLAWVLTDLARLEDGVPLLSALMSDTAQLRLHIEGARRDQRTPDRGVPCPDCVGDGQPAQRLVRHYGHWCTRAGCERLHYLDDSGDVWRCPVDAEHEWSNADYEARLVERRSGRASA